jgi:histidinol dehydrogenase
MRTFFNPSRDLWGELCTRPVMDPSGLENSVREILLQVRSMGDDALYDYTHKFDGAEIESLAIPLSDIITAENRIDKDLISAIRTAAFNIEKFHRAQLVNEEVIETEAGVRCWRKNVPVEKVGIYIPGGTAPLFSTVLMLAIPAKIAGCSKIILCTPPDRTGKIDDLILYAARLAGVTEIFRVGGAQAIAAMAYGTKSVPRVYKIFGPGNQYVTKAKELVQLDGIPVDMPAGPSEVLVIADESAIPSFVAADLISQAEHGTDSQVVLLTTKKDMVKAVEEEIENQLSRLPRKGIAGISLENSLLIYFDSVDECIKFSNEYAPEHLILNTTDALKLTGMITNAGSVFVGQYSCESAGDYASGTNHTLPTNGFARSYGGVSAETFVKKITFQEISAKGIKTLGPVIEKMAEAENLHGHKYAITVRLKSLENG